MRKALQNKMESENEEKYKIIAVDDEDGIIDSLFCLTLTLQLS